MKQENKKQTNKRVTMNHWQRHWVLIISNEKKAQIIIIQNITKRRTKKQEQITELKLIIK